ncbi:unnamed protein product [Agarophyton chilense]
MDGFSSSSQSEPDWSVTELLQSDDDAEIGLEITPFHTFYMHSAVCSVRYNADGGYLIAGGNHCATVFDSETVELVTSFQHSCIEDGSSEQADNFCRAACFSPDGEYVITAGGELDEPSVKVWNFGDSSLKHSISGSSRVFDVDVSSDSRFVASANNGGNVKLWNLDRGELLSTFRYDGDLTDDFTSVAISASTRHVVAGCLDNTVKVWDIETSTLLAQCEGHSDGVYSVSLPCTGNYVISGSLDRTAKMWDLNDSSVGRCKKTFCGHNDFVLSVTTSPDEQWMISGSRDRTVRFWDVRMDEAELQLCGHNNSVISVAHDPSSDSIATGSGDHRVRTWGYD